MKTVTVGQVTFGAGRPKIILPLTGRDRQELLEQCDRLALLPGQVAEWRMDWYDRWSDLSDLLETARLIRRRLNTMPLLATFRTAREGGEGEISMEDYYQLIAAVAESGQADLIDIEAFSGCPAVEELVGLCHEKGVAVVLSNHDFFATPPEEEIFRRLAEMARLGADLPKIALMPQGPEDVLALLSATARARRELDRPVITMSMGPMGVISRLSGQLFGSAATFGSPGRASAPGQVEAAELDRLLRLLSERQ